MSWKPTNSFAPVSRLWRTLAFRLTAAYALAGLLLVLLATASLYLLTVTEMERGTTLFIADKFNVIGTLLRERPNDWEALQEEINLETAARRYEQFYIRLLDERNQPLLVTPGMEERLDLGQLTRQSEAHPGLTLRMEGRDGRIFSCRDRDRAGRLPAYTDRQDSDCDRRLAAGRIPSALPALVLQHSAGNVRRPAANRVSNRTTGYSAGGRHGRDRSPHQFDEPA